MQTNKQACKPLLPPTCGPARWPHAPLPCTASRQPRELEFWGLLREGKSFFTPQNAVGNFHAWSVSETVEGGETAMNFQQFGAAGSSRGHTCPALSQAAPCCFAGGSSLSPPPPRVGFPLWDLSHQGCLWSSSHWWLPRLLAPPKLAGKLLPSGCSLVPGGVPCCRPPHSRDLVMEVFATITPRGWGDLYLPAAQLLVAKPSQGSSVPLP